MGMFDTMRLDNIELPDLHRTDPLDEYQSKSMDCNLDYYRVTSDGRLVVQDTDFMGEGVRFRSTTFSGSADVYNERRRMTLTFDCGRLRSIELF